ncbi:hypothetical protein H2203_007981 [Taxawa tesnikishii (nom. ined.)]|nr:hypothetical protein H2203_007981 [Dothideales sp. JES 119]
MDVAYDHIQEETLTPEETAAREQRKQSNNLNTEFQEAFKAVSSSPWGAKLGGFFGQVKKQSESLYSEAQKEYNTASTTASKGLNDLLSRTRNISIPQPVSSAAPSSFTDPTITLPEQENAKDGTPSTTAGASSETAVPENVERPESLPADIVKEASSLVSRFRVTAAQRLKELEKAEDAADEALLKFGTNIRNFLRDAVVVNAPDSIASSFAGKTQGTGSGEGVGEVLFETNDAEGKRVFHTSRFDAQLHVVHTTASSFTQDPESEAYEPFAKEFDIEEQTEAIASDLEKYEELRRAMEKLVPEKVEYKIFWMRYYFLRKVVEEEERRRKEVLKGAAANPGEEVSWDASDSEGEEEEARTPNATKSTSQSTAESTSTLNPPAAKNDLLKPASPRRSNEEDGKSVAESDASYDIVSGATSRTPGSPKEEKKAELGTTKEEKEEESDDDWE